MKQYYKIDSLDPTFLKKIYRDDDAKLPIGIQTFSEVIEEQRTFVDKTGLPYSQVVVNEKPYTETLFWNSTEYSGASGMDKKEVIKNLENSKHYCLNI